MLLLFAFTASAQSQPEAFKRHALGETLAAFQAKETNAKHRTYDRDGYTLVAAASTRTAFNFPSRSKAPVGENVAVFEDGKLVFLQVAVNSNPAYADFTLFEDIERQLTQDFGPRTNLIDAMTENKLGVTFHQRIVWWIKPDLFVQVVEARHSSSVTLMTTAERQREIMARAKTEMYK